MKTIESGFNPYNNQFDTIEEWSKNLKPSINLWKNKGILQVVSSSILEEEEFLIDLGKGKKIYQFQRCGSRILAFSKDKIGDPIPITNQIYQFHKENFLECLANENGFKLSDESLPEDDYIVGDLPIGDKKIRWICSFNGKGFKNYKTKPYFEELKEEHDFILLSDCFGIVPNIKENKLNYVQLPFNFQHFRIDPHTFIKRAIFTNPDEVRDVLKNIVFFIDNETGKIYYRNQEVNIRKNCYAYKLFMALLKEPLKEHNVEVIVEKKLERSSTSNLSADGRGYKRTLKERLLNTHPKRANEISQFLPDISNGAIRLNLSKKDIFFF